MLSQFSYDRCIVTGFHLPPQFFSCEVGAGVWLPPLPPPTTVSIKLSQGCWTRPLEPTHSNTQQHSAPVSACQQRERETVNHTGQHRKGKWAGERWADKHFISRKKPTEHVACYVHTWWLKHLICRTSHIIIAFIIYCLHIWHKQKKLQTSCSVCLVPVFSRFWKCENMRPQKHEATKLCKLLQTLFCYRSKYLKPLIPIYYINRGFQSKLGCSDHPR